MKLTTTVIVVTIMGASALAQLTSPARTINNVRTQVQSAARTSNQPVANALGSPAKSGTASAATRTPQAKPAVAPAKTKQVQAKAAAQPQPATAETAAKAEQAEDGGTIHMRGKRDPFVSVIRTQGPTGSGCATGKKCLAIGDIALKGVVRSATGMIAVVENAQRKTYFLHVNDPVFNGQVVKIEPDAIVFSERVIDRAGRQSTREVVKRIPKPSIS